MNEGADGLGTEKATWATDHQHQQVPGVSPCGIVVGPQQVQEHANGWLLQEEYRPLFRPEKKAMSHF